LQNFSTSFRYGLFSIFSFKFFFFKFYFHTIFRYRIQLLNFVCNGFKVLFVDHATMFVALIGRKQCYSNESHFQNNVDDILYLIAPQWSILLVFESLEFSFLVVFFWKSNDTLNTWYKLCITYVYIIKFL